MGTLALTVPYTYHWPIRSGDTDFSGLVYTPAVIDCVVEAAQALLEDIDYDPLTAMEDDILYPTAHAEADYLGEISIGDQIIVEITPDIGTTSVTFEALGKLDAVVFESELTLVFVDTDSKEPQPVPDDVAEALSTYAKRQ